MGRAPKSDRVAVLRASWARRGSARRFGEPSRKHAARSRALARGRRSHWRSGRGGPGSTERRGAM